MPKKKKLRRFGKHPWDKWFKRKRFTLTRGKEFSGMPHAMAAQARAAAAKRKLSISVRIQEDTLLIERFE